MTPCCHFAIAPSLLAYPLGGIVAIPSLAGIKAEAPSRAETSAAILRDGVITGSSESAGRGLVVFLVVGCAKKHYGSGRLH